MSICSWIAAFLISRSPEVAFLPLGLLDFLMSGVGA